MNWTNNTDKDDEVLASHADSFRGVVFHILPTNACSPVRNIHFHMRGVWANHEQVIVIKSAGEKVKYDCVGG